MAPSVGRQGGAVKLGPRAPASVLPIRARSLPGALGLAFCLSLPTGGAQAHPELVPTQVNRYLTVAVNRNEIEISLALLFGEIPAQAERRRWDQDEDGTLSDAELSTAKQHYRSATGQLFAAWLAERRIVSRPDAFAILLELGGERSTGPKPLVVERRERHPIERAPVTLRLSPRGTLPWPGETEFGVVLGPDWALRYSKHGTAPAGTDHTFKHEGDNPDVALFALIPNEPQASSPKRSGSSADAPSRLVWLLAATGIALAALIGTRELRRRPLR